MVELILAWIILWLNPAKWFERFLALSDPPCVSCGRCQWDKELMASSFDTASEWWMCEHCMHIQRIGSKQEGRRRAL